MAPTDKAENKPKRRVFCIGLPKTCLTSLLRFMEANGFDAHGRTSSAFKSYIRGELSDVLDFYQTGEFYCDVPTHLMYQLLFSEYGKDAKYILTIIRDGGGWYNSICRHNRYAHPLKNKHKKLYGRYYPHGFKSEHVDYYNKHFNDVVSYFEKNNAMENLLVIDCTQEGAVKKLEDFLGIESVVDSFPHKNKANAIRPGFSFRFKYFYNKIVQPIYAAVAPLLFRKPPPRSWQ